MQTWGDESSMPLVRGRALYAEGGPIMLDDIDIEEGSFLDMANVLDMLPLVVGRSYAISHLEFEAIMEGRGAVGRVGQYQYAPK